MMDDSLDASTSSVLNRLTLDLRGTRFVIERKTLMNLPESVLLCLFPNGLVLSRQQQGLGALGGEEGAEEDEDEEEVYMVDCLSYVLSFFKKAQDDFYGTLERPGRFRGHHNQQSSAEFGDSNSSFGGGPAGQNPLLSKQAIIVLREELEYFSIPPKNRKSATDGVIVPATERTDPSGNANDALLLLKQTSGRALLERKHIFTALQRNVNKENNMAEQHLIDMLCMSGFDRDDVWGFRALEPSRCCITSIALVLLKTGVTHDGGEDDVGVEGHHEDGEDGHAGMRIDQQQLATAQKLLLFWRKPARKCWWDGVDVVIPLPEGIAASPEDVDAHANPAAAGQDASGTTAGMTDEELDLLRSGRGRKVRVWARRVWTLELSLI